MKKCLQKNQSKDYTNDQMLLAALHVVFDNKIGLVIEQTYSNKELDHNTFKKVITLSAPDKDSQELRSANLFYIIDGLCCHSSFVRSSIEDLMRGVKQHIIVLVTDFYFDFRDFMKDYAKCELEDFYYHAVSLLELYGHKVRPEFFCKEFLFLQKARKVVVSYFDHHDAEECTKRKNGAVNMSKYDCLFNRVDSSINDRLSQYIKENIQHKIDDSANDQKDNIECDSNNIQLPIYGTLNLEQPDDVPIDTDNLLKTLLDHVIDQIKSKDTTHLVEALKNRVKYLRSAAIDNVFSDYRVECNFYFEPVPLSETEPDYYRILRDLGLSRYNVSAILFDRKSKRANNGAFTNAEWLEQLQIGFCNVFAKKIDMDTAMKQDGTKYIDDKRKSTSMHNADTCNMGATERKNDNAYLCDIVNAPQDVERTNFTKENITLIEVECHRCIGGDSYVQETNKKMLKKTYDTVENIQEYNKGIIIAFYLKMLVLLQNQKKVILEVKPELQQSLTPQKNIYSKYIYANSLIVQKDGMYMRKYLPSFDFDCKSLGSFLHSKLHYILNAIILKRRIYVISSNYCHLNVFAHYIISKTYPLDIIKYFRPFLHTQFLYEIGSNTRIDKRICVHKKEFCINGDDLYRELQECVSEEEYVCCEKSKNNVSYMPYDSSQTIKDVPFIVGLSTNSFIDKEIDSLCIFLDDRKIREKHDNSEYKTTLRQYTDLHFPINHIFKKCKNEGFAQKNAKLYKHLQSFAFTNTE